MPNWVANTVRIAGSHEDRVAFRERVRDEEGLLSFESLLPTPKRLLRGRRYTDTAAGRRLLVAWDKADDEGKARLLGAHPSLYFIRPDSQLGERDNEGWYYYRLENWGTKGDAIDARVLSWRHELSYEFLTAWSPPVQFVAAAARRFPRLSFELVYHEPGNCFAGFSRYERGRLVDQDEAGEVESIVALLKSRGLVDEAEMWLEMFTDE